MTFYEKALTSWSRLTEKGIVKDAFSEKNYATIGRSVKTFLLATHPDRNPGDAVANSNFVEYAEDAKTIKGICSSEWDFFKLVVYRDEQSEETCLETRGNRMDEQLFATGCIDPVERALYKKAKAALKEVKATIKEEEKAAEVAAAAVAEERRKAAEAAAIEAARKEAEEAAKAAELKAAREARKAASAAKAAERKACEAEKAAEVLLSPEPKRQRTTREAAITGTAAARDVLSYEARFNETGEEVVGEQNADISETTTDSTSLPASRDHELYRTSPGGQVITGTTDQSIEVTFTSPWYIKVTEMLQYETMSKDYKRVVSRAIEGEYYPEFPLSFSDYTSFEEMQQAYKNLSSEEMKILGEIGYHRKVRSGLNKFFL